MAHGIALEIVCFHLQQAAEKLLKAALATCNAEIPHTHDLDRLLKTAASHFPELATFRGRLSGFSAYAVDMRYDATIIATSEEAAAGQATVHQLRRAVFRLLPPRGAALSYNPN